MKIICIHIYTGVSTVGRMTDVLVGAKQQAEKIIQEALNGYNFIKQYVALCNLLIGLNRRKDELGALKRHVKEVSVCVCVRLVCVCVCRCAM